MRRTRKKKITSPFTHEKQKQINVNRRVVGLGGIKQLQRMKTQWRMVTSLRSHTEAPRRHRPSSFSSVPHGLNYACAFVSFNT